MMRCVKNCSFLCLSYFVVLSRVNDRALFCTKRTIHCMKILLHICRLPFETSILVSVHELYIADNKYYNFQVVYISQDFYFHHLAICLLRIVKNRTHAMQ